MTHKGFASGVGKYPLVRSRLALSSVALVMATGCLLPDMKPPRKTGGSAGQAGVAGWQNGTSAGNGTGTANGGTRSSSNDAREYGGATSGGGTTRNTASIGGGNEGGAATNGEVPMGRAGTSSGTSASNIGAAPTGGTRAAAGAPPGGAAPTGGTRATGGALPTTGGNPATGGSTAVSTEIRRPCKTDALACGLNSSDSCCATINMSGGKYPMGRSDATDKSDQKDTSDAYPDASRQTEETPQHDVTVSSFALDKYEVTVGRFRQFVNDYAKWHDTDSNPKEGAGQNPNSPVSPNPTGWSQGWSLPAKADLLTNLKYAAECNWTDTATTNEAYPINCVSWYEAFAYCIWDGGRLPTEAEWEYAAAGGQANRLYPWAGTTIDKTRANYGGTSAGGSPKKAVGSYPTGVGVFGHMDVAGSMWEWVFDWYLESYYANVGTQCNNCANVIASSGRVLRGGSWYGLAIPLRAANRGLDSPGHRSGHFGFRCARPTQ